MPTQPLTHTEIDEALSTLSGWAHEADHLVRTYTLPSYAAGLMFAVAVGTLAEAHDHHPDLSISYKKVRVSLTTHDAQNQVSARDVALARAIEALGYPGPAK